MVGESDALGDIAADRRDRLRQAEVQHLDRAVRPHFDIRGLQVAMDDALLVRGFECIGDLLRDRDGFVERKWTARDPIGQRVAFDQFEDERPDR